MNGQQADKATHSDYVAIVKDPTRLLPAPYLDDYGRVCAGFSWQRAQAMLSGLPGGGLNIAHEAVDRHAAGTRAEQVALRWLAACRTQDDG